MSELLTAAQVAAIRSKFGPEPAMAMVDVVTTQDVRHLLTDREALVALLREAERINIRYFEETHGSTGLQIESCELDQRIKAALE